MTKIQTPRLGVIGFGAMASAMVNRLLSVGLIEKTSLFVSTRSGRGKALSVLGVENHSNEYIVENCDVILLGVKPYQLHEVTADLQFRTDQVSVSILAGTDLKTLAATLSPAEVIRTMPNLAVGLGCGIIAEMGLDRSSNVCRSWIKAMLESFGIWMPLQKEPLFDGVTALAGSAPAFCFVMAQAMADAAVLEGVSRKDSELLAAAVMEGAGAMLRTEGLAPETLKDRVASPKGTTISGLRALEAGGFRSAVIEAISASAERSRQLSKG